MARAANTYRQARRNSYRAAQILPSWSYEAGIARLNWIKGGGRETFVHPSYFATLARNVAEAEERKRA